MGLAGIRRPGSGICIAMLAIRTTRLAEPMRCTPYIHGIYHKALNLVSILVCCDTILQAVLTAVSRSGGLYPTVIPPGWWLAVVAAYRKCGPICFVRATALSSSLVNSA